MKDSADSVSYSDLNQGRGSHCALTGIVHVVSEYTEKLILSVHQEFSVSISFFTLSLLLSSVSLLCMLTLHAMETDGGLQ